jgi:hypothetical protein
MNTNKKKIAKTRYIVDPDIFQSEKSFKLKNHEVIITKKMVMGNFG